MRFVAALLVFLTHVSNREFFSDQTINTVMVTVFSKASVLGVSFFFVLSGFVLTWSVRSTDTTGRFWRRRLVKIFPNHVVTWLLGIILFLVAGKAVTVAATVPSLFLLQAWVPVPQVIASINGPSWTLSCELVFYMAFPLLHRLLDKIPARRLWLTAGLAVLAVIVMPAIAGLLPQYPKSPWGGGSAWGTWVLYAAPPVRMIEFLIGMVMARIVLSGQWIRLRLSNAALLVLGGYALMLVLPGLWGWGASTVVPLALFIPAAAMADVNSTHTPTRGRIMVRLGEWSFAFYMIHYLVLLAVVAMLPSGRQYPVPVALALIVGVLAASIGAARLLHRGVELPLMRRWSVPGRPVPAGVNQK